MSTSSDRITSHAEFHVSFVYAALAIALTAGFGYAAVLAFLIGFDLPLGDWLVSALQAHGHAQLRGWAGLFIIGVSLHFIPRMTGAPLRFPRLLPWICGLLSVGIGLRSVAQPLLDVYAGGAVRPALRWGMGIAALMEAAGVGFYLLLLVTTMRRSGADRQAIRPVRPFLITALIGWGLSTLLVTCLSLGAALGDRQVLDLAWNRFGADLYLGLVLLPVGMAFSVRTFPLYLRLPAPRWPVRLVAGLYLFGFALERLPELLSLTGLLSSDGGIRTPLSGAGRGVKGAALIWFVWELDILLRRKAPWTVERVGEPAPDRKKTREGLPDYGEFGRFERLLYAAYVWLFVAAGLDVGGGVTMMLKGALPVHADAVRHAYLAGFISLLIFGMAPRMIPGFVHVRRLALPGLVDVTFYLAGGAALCRVLPLLLPGDLIGRFPLLAQGSTYAFGLSGILGWTAAAALAWNLVKSVGSGGGDRT
ncbi:MAG: hypothetical protein A3F84_22260 [Candidatus Handelsmanbacteria bacterium RIFCSPLOWO2_12_FULL_64_10]|uniref:NnrS family protein n=1 Tax=Handelsmanbacteria sp. (strain RIFCSPLOWO2_12_FULL_64_10) TaxID=1817868 RepID=A0A1F6D4J4_HANXR|nr:MAG: hypothetical protein A3F84_22260 [Candidatus Handelsmanbacteria bacterium RIFCSPLOWO2_12_FULL_64_10]